MKEKSRLQKPWRDFVPFAILYLGNTPLSKINRNAINRLGRFEIVIFLGEFEIKPAIFLVPSKAIKEPQLTNCFIPNDLRIFLIAVGDGITLGIVPDLVLGIALGLNNDRALFHGHRHGIRCGERSAALARSHDDGIRDGFGTCRIPTLARG